jgi:hypothetical protein
MLRQRGLEGPTFDERQGLWLDEDEPSSRRRTSTVRLLVGVVATMVCLAIVGVPVGLVLTSHSPHSTSGTKLGTTKLGTAEAKHRVLSALSATISSGSFNMTYAVQPPTAPESATSTEPCSSVAVGAPLGASPSASGTWCSHGPAPTGLAVSGQGTIDTSPFAMVASSNVPGIGPVTVRDDGTDVWEIGGGDYGLSPGSTSTGPGSPISGFASLVEGTLGPRQGGVAMMGLASPTGYLELDQNAITSASQTGTGVVDGVPVTVYQVSLSPAQQASVPGTTSEEARAIQDALAVLQQHGYTGTTVKVSIDNAGFIRQTVSVAAFNGGATQTSEATFSDFGCAGRVLMPGQQGATSPPSGCVSPDSAASTTQTTTTS